MAATVCVLGSPLQGIDWSNMDSQGNMHKPELLTEVVADCEPSDMPPPGASGPPTSIANPSGTGAATGGAESTRACCVLLHSLPPHAWQSVSGCACGGARVWGAQV